MHPALHQHEGWAGLGGVNQSDAPVKSKIENILLASFE